MARAARTRGEAGDLSGWQDLVIVTVGYAGALRMDDLHRARVEHLDRLVYGYGLRFGLVGDYGSHSPRAGFTTDCIDAGITREHVQHHGRWRNIRSLDPDYRKTSASGTTNPATRLVQHD